MEVYLIYDPWGSPGANKKFLLVTLTLEEKVAPFITSRDMIRKNTSKLSLASKKIVVIDGKIGRTGGFNVGDQYLNVTEKFGYWRDTHIRLVGTAVFFIARDIYHGLECFSQIS